MSSSQVYQSGELTIRSQDVNNSRFITISKGDERIAIITQKMSENIYKTTSLSPWYRKNFYGVYSDEDDDGHFESLIILNPLDETKFQLYDINTTGDASVSSEEKQRLYAEMSGLVTELWEETMPSVESVDEAIEESKKLKEKLQNLKSDQGR